MKKAHIFYHRVPNQPNPQAKLELIRTTPFEALPFESITPDDKANWINQTDNDFESLIPVCDKKVKLGRSEGAIFKLFSLGVSTNRDEWVYDVSRKNLENKIKYFIKVYDDLLLRNSTSWDDAIKWSRDLKKKFLAKDSTYFISNSIIKSCYKPFSVRYWYADKLLNDIFTQNHVEVIGNDLNQDNKIMIWASYDRQPFILFTTKLLPNLNFYGDPANIVPLYRYDADGNRHDNITDWGLGQFRAQYADEITKLDIFHYVYAVLHNPAYRKKYELNLKREFPRIPFYADFWQWAAWGKSLMELHLNYEMVEPYPLNRVEMDVDTIKPKLKADKVNHRVILDSATILTGVPALAWEYRLGNRSALEWILDQYKEKKPRDPTIREKFNTYRFSDYKEVVIDLLLRVCRVSVETMGIVGEMPDAVGGFS